MTAAKEGTPTHLNNDVLKYMETALSLLKTSFYLRSVNFDRVSPRTPVRLRAGLRTIY